MSQLVRPAMPLAKPRPHGLMRWLLRVPPFLYRVGFARFMGGRLLLLTTTGRRTGRRRTCGLNYVVERDTVYVMSGYGATDWYRNLIADRHVEVQIGRQRWTGISRPVTDAGELQRARLLLRQLAPRQGPPRLVRSLIRRMGLDYDAEIRRLDDPAFDLPTVAIERAAPPSA